MAEDSDEDRTEDPSGKRLSDARSDGQVPQSRDLSTFISLLVGVVSLWVTGSWISQNLLRMVRVGLSFSREMVFDPKIMTGHLLLLFQDGLLALMPYFLAVILAAVLGPLAMGSVIFSGKIIQPNFSRLSPLSGISRIFSTNGLVELLKSLLKVMLIGYVVWWVLRHQQAQILSLFSTSLQPGMRSFLDIVFFSSIMIVAGMALIAAIDVPYQKWSYMKRLKMSKEEVRRENKESEGDPHVKGRIRAKQREMAQRRMMAEVPKANVVVTNPTHYAVALKYDGETMAAPQVVATGKDAVAAKIRELARDNGVPMLEAPALARALFTHTDPGDAIPPSLFTAVAEVMAYIYHLNRFVAEGGMPPQMPSNIAVPDGMDPGAS